MGNWTVVVENRSGKRLVNDKPGQPGIGAPDDIADGANATITATREGVLDYHAGPGVLFGARWHDGSDHVEAFGLDLDVSSRPEPGKTVALVRARPPVCHPVVVVSGSQATICLADYLAMRRRIAESGNAEFEKWKAIGDPDATSAEMEKQRLPLRLQYAEAWGNPIYRKGMRDQFSSHSSGTKAWCGVFGIWNVSRVQTAGVAWVMTGLGGAPGGVLRCRDIQKVHTGDVAHAWDDIAKFNRDHAAWVASGSPDGKEPGIANHHVLVTSAKARPVTTVEGNAARHANTYNVVVSTTRELGEGEVKLEKGKTKAKLDFFYCSVPHPTCVQIAKDRGTPGQCPYQEAHQPCLLPEEGR